MHKYLLLFFLLQLLHLVPQVFPDSVAGGPRFPANFTADPHLLALVRHREDYLRILDWKVEEVRVFMNIITNSSEKFLGAATPQNVGLGDCIKGAASTFYAALASHRRFVFSKGWTPDLLEHNFDGVSAARHPQVDSSQEFALMNTFFNDGLAAAKHVISLLHEHEALPFLQLRMNGDIGGALVEQGPPTLDFLRGLRPSDYMYIFTRLFLSQPSVAMQGLLDDLDDSASSTAADNGVLRIGVQLRLTEQRYHFIDSIIPQVIATLSAICSPAQGAALRCSVFVTSDEVRHRNHLVEALQSFIPHSFAPQNAPQHFATRTEGMATWRDWLMLQRCHVLLTSRSGFSETAVWSSPNSVLALAISTDNTHHWVNCLDRTAFHISKGWNYCGRVD